MIISYQVFSGSFKIANVKAFILLVLLMHPGPINDLNLQVKVMHTYNISIDIQRFAHNPKYTTIYEQLKKNTYKRITIDYKDYKAVPLSDTNPWLANIVWSFEMVYMCRRG